jgi:predicted MFS family arabinose efflux permease
MLESYRRVFAHRGAAAFSATGMVARLPISMMTLGIVILVSSLTGSYGLAGQISAAYVIGNALVSIPHGRLVDRFGQTTVLFVDTVTFALTAGLLVHAITSGWATPWPHLLAALTGASIPPVGSMIRGRWAHVTDEQERHTAFAVEAVVDEVVFVAGPGLVTFLSTLYAPQTGLLTALALGTGGTLLLALQPRTAPPAHPRDAELAREPMPWARLAPIALLALGMGSVFGAMEVATVAVASDAGHRSVSGVLLAAFSLGSMVAGLAAGAIHWSFSNRRRFQVGIGLLAPAMVVLPFLHHLAILGVVLFVIGTALAPSMIAVISEVEQSTPRSRLTEAMAVFHTGIATGIAPGAYLAGIVVDHSGGSAAYWVSVGSAFFAAAAALSCRPALDRPALDSLSP